MSEQKFPPRVWIEIKQRQFTTNTKGSVPVASFSSGKNRVEYLSLTEHQHILAEKEKRIERLREAAQELIDEIDGQAELGGPTFDDGKLRSALQEEPK